MANGHGKKLEARIIELRNNLELFVRSPDWDELLRRILDPRLTTPAEFRACSPQ
jgi:hypothetical protein